MSEAIIVVILKPGKDAMSPDSYRPISLLSFDVKLLARVLANRLSKCIHHVVHRDQSGFIPTRSTAQNLRRLFLNLQIPVDNPGDRAMFSLDAAKAFDSVEWPYLWEVLMRFGVGSTFLKWVQLLYSAPTARMRVNGELSDSFRLFRGTRQGCPLSPLLFALALEPLAIHVRASQDIVGFCRGPRQDTISLYADDTLIYLGDMDGSLRNVMALIADFGQLSGFNINWNKSVLLPLDPLTHQLPDCARDVLIVNEFRYLGIQVTADPTQYLPLNLTPLLRKFRAKCSAWLKLPLSITGRANLVKMIWAPQLLYIFHNAPVWIPHTWFTQIDAQFRSLIWGNKVARISLSSLQLAKDQGGMAVPHARYYFVASQLQHLGGWGEEDAEDPIRLLVVPCGSELSALSHLEAGLTHLSGSLPTVRLLNSLWKYTRALLRIKGICSFTPIWDNKYFTELLKLENFRSWEIAGIRYITQLYRGMTLKSFTDLREEFSLHRFQFYRYLQLRHAIQSETRLSPLRFSTHPLMAEVFMIKDKKGMISNIYSVLLSVTHDASSLPCRRGWEKDLGPIDGETWELCLASAPLVSVSASRRLSHLFLFHRVYRTPVRLYKWGCRDLPLCPKCCAQEGDLLHMMWKCPKIFRYWNFVLTTISQTYQIPIPQDPVVCLLGALEIPSLSPNGHTAIIRLLYIARTAIARLWISSRVPTDRQWIEDVNRLLIKEKLTYQHRNALRKFYSMWQPWLDVPGLGPPQLITDRLLQGNVLRP